MSEEKDIVQEADEVKRELRKQNDPKRSFFMGALAGLGGVFGATVLVAVAITIFTLLGGVPLIGDLFHWLGAQLGTK